MRLSSSLALALAVVGCKTGSSGVGGSSVKEEVAPTQQVVGLDILDNRPAITQIPADADPETDWAYSSGNEYWLYSSRGRYMTFDSDDYYAPYQNRQACDGRTSDPNSACSVKPSKVAQACQYTASLTLAAIMQNEPEEYTQIKQTYGGSFMLFGWMNDGHSDADYATPLWQEPFIWRGDAQAIQINGSCPSDFTRVSGYVKWVSSIDKNGVCKTPSKGQFLALLRKAKECLERNNGH